MIQKIRTSKVSKFIAIYLALMIFLEVVAPMKAYALTGGPSQPEFESFTPIDTSDMVDLSSGDFNYNIPVMDVGGYPINLAYTSGAGMDQEASWVGLGWDLNVGQISRQLRGLPDDFDGDKMTYENTMKPNVTVGANFGIFGTTLAFKEKKATGPIQGQPSPNTGGGNTGAGTGESTATPTDVASAPSLNYNAGFGLKFNNYEGFTFSLTGGISYQIAENIGVGMNMSSSADGVTASPSVSFSKQLENNAVKNLGLNGNVGMALNSRKGIEGYTFGGGVSASTDYRQVKDKTAEKYVRRSDNSTSGTISLINSSYTPSKRVGMTSSSFTFNMNIEGEFWGSETGGKFSGYKTTQGIKDSEKFKTEKAFGYENTYNATDNDILDVNRENDRTFSTNTTSLPVVNHTYDLYNIQGQGIAGMFRPYKSQVGYSYDKYVSDESSSGSLGVELGGGGGVHFGVDGELVTSKSSTGVWKASNLAISKFQEKKTGNRIDYEKVFFKNIGGNHVDDEFSLFESKLGGYAPVQFTLSGGKFSRKLNSRFAKKNLVGTSPIEVTGAIKREKRLRRNQVIEKLSMVQAARYGFDTQFSPYALPGIDNHHTAEIRITKEGGERYVYGRAAYNITKKEVTFDVSGRIGDCKTGLVDYNPGVSNSTKNDGNGDEYFNRVTTPGYAHSYLLTAVLSPDYQDLKKDGPTDDDLGSYTKFVYNDSKTKNNSYKWRIPYDANKANYEEGLKTSRKDDKGNYLYGEKEMIYIDTIVTKTHIAIFEISPRQDGYGVDGEDGGGNASTTSRMYKLDKITLYSKPEFKALGAAAVPIKTAHFVYDYSLCPNVKNNFNTDVTQRGKLTLKKVYFTYGKSNMGQYTPYTFNYGETANDYTSPNPFNPAYDLKAYDTWGNYKPNLANGCSPTSSLTNAEFPYVEQNKATADQYATVWTLRSIQLPSGGKVEIQYESDDYAYVQDKEVMQMFKVVGAGLTAKPTTAAALNSNILYGLQGESNRMYIKLNKPIDQNAVPSVNDYFVNHYLKGIQDKPIYFRFLVNMAKPGTYDDRYDYVTGYLRLNKNAGFTVFDDPVTGEKNAYASIAVTFDSDMNPVTKAGLYFGRQYLNRLVYNNPADEKTNDLEEVVKDIIKSLPNAIDIIKSPNKQLRENLIASRFIQNKSWIRLMQPEGKKYGGGNRVIQVKMYDQWNIMTNQADNESSRQYYGQQYSYTNADGTTSGVATYEPLGNKENPLVQPFYNEADPGILLGPMDTNYAEKPLGECFYPSPKITYGRVTVKNLERNKVDGSSTSSVKKHATGSVVTTFFTSKDYPTIADYTDLTREHDPSTALAGLLNLHVRDHMTLTQGYTVHTNDMDGKVKSEHVYAEGQKEPISSQEYIYENTDRGNTTTYNPNQGKLNNIVTTINSEGKIEDKLVGVDYDVINDFRENKSETTTAGVNFNMAILPFGLATFPFPTLFPSSSVHENQLRTAVTTKVIHTCGILRETKVHDVGSTVSTKNLAWDAQTGAVLLTETVNEYNDKYYSFNYPAYWAYSGMSQAANNIGLTSKLKAVPGTSGKYQLSDMQNKASDYLQEGDELWIKPISYIDNEDAYEHDEFRAFVVNIQDEKFELINEKGTDVLKTALETGEFTIARSGHRNMQSASMASITSMLNPLYDGAAKRTSLPEYTATAWNKYRIINASAIEYNDTWAAQCECNLPKMQFEAISGSSEKRLVFNYSNDERNKLIAYNPYTYNIKGNWRPNRSYAYLTGRNYNANPNPRTTGYYNDFTPFYVYNATTKKWNINNSQGKWHFASEVTQYNPYGFEVENKDALGRYSTALYGYNFRFPVAVASNTQYTDLAYDGFEDYEMSLCSDDAHFNYQSSLSPNKISISTTQSHTGRKSIKMAPQTRATIKKQIVPCTP